jgi:hypothetical protein
MSRNIAATSTGSQPGRVGLAPLAQEDAARLAGYRRYLESLERSHVAFALPTTSGAVANRQFALAPAMRPSHAPQPCAPAMRPSHAPQPCEVLIKVKRFTLSKAAIVSSPAGYLHDARHAPYVPFPIFSSLVVLCLGTYSGIEVAIKGVGIILV